MKLKDMIKFHEGLKLKPYKCTAGKLSIGYGRNLEDVGITEEEADFLLEHDVEKAIFLATRYLPWYSNLDPVRQDVVASMVFNMGLVGFQKFKNLIAAIAFGDFQKASDEMLNSTWSKQVGERSQMLARMMRTGLYPD